MKPRHDQRLMEWQGFINRIAARVAQRADAWWCYEDLRQAGWLALLQRLDRYDPKRGASITSYAYILVLSGMMDELRRLYPGSRVLKNAHLHAPYDYGYELGGDRDPTFDAAARAEAPRVIAELFAALSPREAQVARLYSGGMRLREIGALLHCSESRVCQIHQRSLRKMRDAARPKRRASKRTAL